jgi:hypothetical protein
VGASHCFVLLCNVLERKKKKKVVVFTPFVDLVN